MKNILKILGLIIIMPISTFSQSAGTIDKTFNAHHGDRGNGPDNDVNHSLVQSDGKVVIAGTFTLVDGFPRLGLARLLGDGRLDPSFLAQSNGIPIRFLTINSIALQADGKLLVAGTCRVGTIDYRYLRLNEDGSLDTSFSLGNQSQIQTINKLLVLGNGKIILGGRFSAVQSIARNSIARLNTNGTVDQTFNPGTGPSLNSTIMGLALQGDGNILAFGNFTTFNGQSLHRIVRLFSNGSVDGSFQVANTAATGSFFDIAIQSDGKIVIVGFITSSHNGLSRGIIRVHRTGSIDNSFCPGTGFEGNPTKVAIQKSGKILVGRGGAIYDGVPVGDIVRLGPGGTLDEGFNKDVNFSSVGGNNWFTHFFLDNDDRIFVGGLHHRIGGIDRRNFSLLDCNGHLTEGFMIQNVGPSGLILDFEIQPDGKIVAAGQFTTYDGIKRPGLVRLDTSGTVDVGFEPELPIGFSAREVTLQADGKILVGGSVLESTGLNIWNPAIVRLNSDGSTDTSFSAYLGMEGTNAAVGDITLQADGKIFVSGYGEDLSGRTFIFRLFTDGSVDESFAAKTVRGADDVREGINSVIVLPNGKIMIFGGFTDYDGVFMGGLARLFPDGTLDRSFDPGSGVYGTDDTDYNGVTKALLQDDGKILIYGLNSYKGVPKSDRVVRIHSDGSIDQSFVPSHRFEHLGALQPDGSILAIYSQNETYRIGRFNPNGDLDIDFDSSGINFLRSFFNTLRIQPDGNIVTTGPYSGENGQVREGLVRILNDIGADICGLEVLLRQEVVVELNQDGVGFLLPEMVDLGSSSSCGAVTLELDKSEFTCADLGENQVMLTATDEIGNQRHGFTKVYVVDDLPPTLNESINEQSFVWLIPSGSFFTLPDFRSVINAADNCTFEVSQMPAPGTIFTTPQNTHIDFEVRDASDNIKTARLNFTLLVLDINNSGLNSRTSQQASQGFLSVPWNTPLVKVINEGLRFEEGSNVSALFKVDWQANNYQQLVPGSYSIVANIGNPLFQDFDFRFEVPVLVRAKPMATDIQISKNKLGRNIRNGEIIGTLSTLDPVDNIHQYSVDENPYFFVKNDVLAWKGENLPAIKMSIVVHSLDRAGQLISSELVFEREYSGAEEVLVFPNPATSEIDVEIRLNPGAEVSIAVYDANGRLVFEDTEQSEGPFVRSFGLEGLSSGLYIILVRNGGQVIAKQFVKR